jgi:hypothetical protein
MSAVPVTHMSARTTLVGISESHSQTAWATRSEVGAEEVPGDGAGASSTSAMAAGMVTSASLVSWPVLMGTPPKAWRSPVRLLEVMVAGRRVVRITQMSDPVE